MSDIYDLREELHEMVEELKKYAEEEGSEVGEVCMQLCHCIHWPDYVSDDFSMALYNEIKSQLKWFKENTQWVEKEETFKRKVRYLETIY